MLTVNSPYYQVQAIRRRLREDGIPTLAKPYNGYKAIVNLPTTAGLAAVGAQSSGNVKIDTDSYFVWLSTYHYNQSTDWVDNKAIGNPNDAEGGGFDGSVRVRIQNLNTGRQYHSGDFIDPLFFDWFQASRVGFNATPQSELDGDGDTSTTGFHIFRCHWPEPVLLHPADDLKFTCKVMNVAGGISFHAQLFVLTGVRLFLRRP